VVVVDRWIGSSLVLVHKLGGLVKIFKGMSAVGTACIIISPVRIVKLMAITTNSLFVILFSPFL
jgi:hypothetical protein